MYRLYLGVAMRRSICNFCSTWWRAQFPARSALRNLWSVSIISMYCKYKAAVLLQDFWDSVLLLRNYFFLSTTSVWETSSTGADPVFYICIADGNFIQIPSLACVRSIFLWENVCISDFLWIHIFKFSKQPRENHRFCHSRLLKQTYIKCFLTFCILSD